MDRKGLEARLVSHVKMFPFAWPPATLVWSADMAMAVIGPDSTAIFSYISHDKSKARLTDLICTPLVPGPIIILRF